MSISKTLRLSAEKIQTLASQEVDKLESQLKDAKAICKLATALSTYAQRSYYLHILELRTKQADLIHRAQQSCHSACIDILKIFEIAEAEANKLMPLNIRFPTAFSQACQNENLKIDSDSRHPKYTFDNRFFEVKLDETKKMAYVSNYEAGKLEGIPADIPAIIECLQRHRKRVFDKAKNDAVFLKLLRQEYLKSVKAYHKKDGDSIPIRFVIDSLAKRKDSDKYQADEFVVALSQILKEGQTKIDGFQLDLQQTKNTKDGVLPITENNRGYVGFLLFRKCHD